MDKDEAVRQMICFWVDKHKYAYNMIDYVKDEEQRQAATATVLIQVGKQIYREGYPKGPMPEPDFQTADKIDKPSAPVPPPPTKDVSPGDMATEKQIKYLMRLAGQKNVSIDSIKKQMNVSKLEDIGKNAMSALIEEMGG